MPTDADITLTSEGLILGDSATSDRLNVTHEQAHTPIIVLTANNTCEQCTYSAINDFVNKPYLPDHLALKIAGHLTPRTILQ